jgi:glycosyltransferase involved in cell wall biosynthesis
MQPKVSIIVPVYNTEKYVHRCLTSLLNQTLKELEVIVVDDHGTDNSIEICKQIALTDDRLKIVRSEVNSGCGMARNFGLDVACGEFVAFVDSDDYIDLDAYRLLYEAAKKYDSELVCFFPQRVLDDNGAKVDVSAGLSVARVISSQEDKNRLALNFFSKRMEHKRKDLIAEGSSCMKLIHRSLVEDKEYRFPYIPHMLSEDYLFSYRAVKRTNKPVVILPYKFYNYRITPNSITTTPNPDKIYRAIESATYFESMIKKISDSPEFLNYPKMFVIDYIWVAMRCLFETDKSEADKKKWFLKLANNDYLMETKKVFPFNQLNMKHRLGCYALFAHKYQLMKFIIVGQLKFRRMIGRN